MLPPAPATAPSSTFTRASKARCAALSTAGEDLAEKDLARGQADASLGPGPPSFRGQAPVAESRRSRATSVAVITTALAPLDRTFTAG